MKILDRYILLRFLKTFLFTVLMMVFIICIIDYTEHTEEFLKHDLSFGQIFSEYYLNYIPFMTSTLSPIAVFITVVFMTSRLASHSEIIAISSSGVSLGRLLVPYLIGASILASIIFGLVGWVIPNAAKEKVTFENKYLQKAYQPDERNIHFRISDSTYVYMERYNKKINTGYKFSIEKFEGKKLKEKLTASTIKWDTLKNVWNIPKYKVHTFDQLAERVIEGKNQDTTIYLTPKYFSSNFNLHETMTINELNNFIKEQDYLGIGNTRPFKHEKNERFSYPYAILILTVMGVFVSHKKSREGTGFQIAFGFLLAFIYILFVVMSRSIAAAGSLPPFIAAWLPNIIFTFISIGMFFYAQRR